MGGRGKRFSIQAVAIGALILFMPGIPGIVADPHPPPGPPDLTVGYSANVFVDVDIEGARSVTQVWSDQILKRWFREGTSQNIIFQDLESIEEAFRTGKVDLAALVCDDYVRLKDRVPLQPVFVTENNQGIYHRIVLVVRSDQGFRTMDDLRGKRLMVPMEQARTVHMAWLETLLMKKGDRFAADFFSTVREVRRPSQGILPVFFRQADACLTTRNSFDVVCELNPQVGKELTVLAQSPDIAGGVVVFRPDYNDKHKKKLTEILAELQRDPQGRQLLKLFRMNRLIPFRPEFLETAETLLKEHEQLRYLHARRN